MFTFRMILIAVIAAVALIGAAFLTVPLAQEGVRLCLDFARCVGF